MDRDLRTVFVSQVTIKATKEDIADFFKPAGPVADVFIIRDSRTRKSKGMAYVEMKKSEDVPKALQLVGRLGRGGTLTSCQSGQNCRNLPCIVQASQAERNREALLRISNPTITQSRLHVTNLPDTILEEHLQMLFAPFGTVERAEIERDAMGRSRGSGFVTFRSQENCKRAQQSLNGVEVEGKAMVVAIAHHQQAGAGGSVGGPTTIENLDDGGAPRGGFCP